MGYGDFIGLGVDMLFFGLSYWQYQKCNRAMELVQNAPKVELNHLDLGNKLVTPDRTLEYVFLEGEVKALGKPLQSQFGDKKGVIQQLTYIEHKTKKNAGVWSDVTRPIRETCETVPFAINNPATGWGVLVTDPMSAHYIDEAITVTYDKYVPNDASAWSKVIDRFSGDVSKGFQETEKMLEIGTHMISLGKISIEDGKIKLFPPTIPGARYILSKLNRTEIIKKLNSSKSIWKGLAYLTGFIGVGLILYMIRKYYRQWQENRENQETFEEIRNRRAAGTVPRVPRQLGGEEVPMNAEDQTCVVCLTNPRELVFLECGHICSCADCAEILPSPKKCPICRQDITRMLPTFTP